MIVDSDRDVVRDRDDLPSPEAILTRVLERHAPDRLSAHQTIADSLHETSSLARLGAIFEDAARTATAQWLRHTLTEQGLADAIHEPQWPALIGRVRETALAGHDVAAFIDEAIRMRPIDDAHSGAAVLHWRLGMLGSTPAPRARGPLASLPPTDGLAIEVAHQAGELIRRRWRDIRASLGVATDPIPGAQAFGAPPPDPDDRSAWLTATTAVTAYRERFEIPDHTPCSAPVRPAHGPTPRQPSTTPASKPTATSPAASTTSTTNSSPTSTPANRPSSTIRHPSTPQNCSRHGTRSRRHSEA